MSYCRFSSMNWRCDVYVYEHCDGGWTTCVAGRRRPFGPIPDIIGGRSSMVMSKWAGGEWSRETRSMVYPIKWRAAVYKVWLKFVVAWHRLHMLSLELIPLEPIGLPFDGEGFSDPTPGECASRLEWLRDMGYIVPQYAIDALRAEARESQIAREAEESDRVLAALSN